MVQRVLLTGANGFIASHVLSDILARGWSVRAVVRSQAKADQVISDFPKHGSQLDTGIVPDITAPGAFDEVVKSSPPFDTVIHTASPFLYRVISDNQEFIDPAIKGTVGVLKSIKAHAPSVQRVVLTSSCAAVVDFNANPTATPLKTYTGEDWNPVTLEEALAGTPNKAYQASKKFAELSAWDFIKDEKPNFDLVILNPPMVYGPLRHTVNSPDDLNQSNSNIYKNFINTFQDAPLPPNAMHVYTDVRDLSNAHILAATVPEASNKRFVICAGQVSAQNIADILRANIPELEKRTPKGVPGGNPLPENSYTCSSALAEKVLGLKFRDKEETFTDLGKQLVEIENKGKK